MFGFIFSFWKNYELSIAIRDLWPLLHSFVSVEMMTQEGWNLTPENDKGMTELVLTIGLVPCWSRAGWASTVEKHWALTPAPLLASHLHCPYCSQQWSEEDGGISTCWASYGPGAQLIILPGLQVRHYHPYSEEPAAHSD